MKIQKFLQLLRDNAEQQRKPLSLVRNEADAEATLYIYDVIDPWWGVSAAQVAPMIAALDPSTTLHVRMNTPGGDVFEGRAIRTAIKQFKGKTIGHIDGLAASAGTTIIDGCDEIEIVAGAFYMIHNGWTYAVGNRHEMRKTAGLLEQVDGAIVADYAKRTGLDLAQLATWMDEETWFTAEQAVEHGFVSRLAPDAEKDAAAQDRGDRKWNLAAYDKTPQALLTPPAPPEPDFADIAAKRAQSNARRLQLLEID